MLNKTLSKLEKYSSKDIAMRAKTDSSIANLSFGEPYFGPPPHLLPLIEKHDLTTDIFMDGAKRYENSRGDIQLRKTIAAWYLKRYNMTVNPETEIMITNGGVEAINLSILCTSDQNETVAYTEPSYMLYERTIKVLSRQPLAISREPQLFEYSNIFSNRNNTEDTLKKAKTIIINSPENPSGYILDNTEWRTIEQYADENNLWVIHDEVYDTMSLNRKHKPFRTRKSIIINSFSKKFGTPGLRIGWMVADKEVIDLASKLHDYLYLGMNIQYEKIAMRILQAAIEDDSWLTHIAENLQERAKFAMQMLTKSQGFSWPRYPLGAMFLFPNVSEFKRILPLDYQENFNTIGEAVAEFLLIEKKVAVVPGVVYGESCHDYIRMVLCTDNQTFNKALARLSEASLSYQDKEYQYE